MQPQDSSTAPTIPDVSSALPDNSAPVELATEPIVEEELLLDWGVQDHAAHHRSTTWYIGLGLIFAITIVASILTKTWVFIPLGILAPWALSIYATRGTGDHHYSLSTYTFQVDAKMFRYEAFKAFFVVDNKESVAFELVPTQRFMPLVTLHATGDDIEEVADILSSVLPETEPQGYIGESVFRRLKL